MSDELGDEGGEGPQTIELEPIDLEPMPEEELSDELVSLEELGDESGFETTQQIDTAQLLGAIRGEQGGVLLEGGGEATRAYQIPEALLARTRQDAPEPGGVEVHGEGSFECVARVDEEGRLVVPREFLSRGALRAGMVVRVRVDIEPVEEG